MENTRVLSVGIDLGTSRTVIACSNGMRTFVPSYVGFAKDAVTSKMLGSDVVFGEKALRYKMAVDLHRPINQGVIQYSDDPEKHKKEYEKTISVSKELIKHVISLVTMDEETDGLMIRGVIGAPALASRKNKNALLEISRGIIDDVMIVSEPFTVAYGLNRLYNSLIIDIGAGTVDLCRMQGTLPSEEDQITTLMAGDHVDQVFLNLIKKKYKNANFTVNMVKKFKEDNAFVSAHGEKISIVLPVEGKPTSHDVTDELREACREIVPDIVNGIKKLVASFNPEFQDELKAKIILAGGGSQTIGLKKEIERYMKKTLGYGKVTKVDEPLYAGANGALMLARDMPDEYWDELKSKS